MSTESLIKFAGNDCSAISCGSQNPVAAAMAMAMLSDMGGRSLSVTSGVNDIQAQSVGAAMQNSGIALG